MDTGIAGKTALVAASSRGIGFAAAKLLAEEGANLVICSRDKTRIEAAAGRIRDAAGVEVVPVVADLAVAGRAEDVVQQAADRFGAVDILVTNVGGPPSLEFEEIPDDLWQTTFEQLFMSAQGLIRHSVASMKERGWGRVICITSSACKEPIPGLILSNAVRTSVHGLIKTLSRTYAADGVTFNVVMPGLTLTDRMKELTRVRAEQQGITPEEYMAGWAESIPIGRPAHAEEVAAAVVFLASVQASAITGTGLLVDGGRSQHLL